jgi:hypothetical protein
LSDFFRLINDKPLASSLLEVYSKQQDRETLKDYYYQADRRFDGAIIVALEAYEATDIATRIRTLKTAMSLFQDDKEQQATYRATEDQVKLLALQEEMQKETKDHYVGLSLSDTVHKLILTGNQTKASKLKSDFKMSDSK